MNWTPYLSSNVYLTNNRCHVLDTETAAYVFFYNDIKQLCFIDLSTHILSLFRLKLLSSSQSSVVSASKKNKINFFFPQEILLKINVQHPFIISKSKPKLKIAFKMLIWLGSEQHAAVSLLPSTIKSHMVKIALIS